MQIFYIFLRIWRVISTYKLILYMNTSIISMNTSIISMNTSTISISIEDIQAIRFQFISIPELNQLILILSFENSVFFILYFDIFI